MQLLTFYDNSAFDLTSCINCGPIYRYTANLIQIINFSSAIDYTSNTANLSAC